MHGPKSEQERLEENLLAHQRLEDPFLDPLASMLASVAQAYL